MRKLTPLLMCGRPIEAVSSFQKTFKFSMTTLKFNHTVMAEKRTDFRFLILFTFCLHLFLSIK